jgi:hypothetical protein
MLFLSGTVFAQEKEETATATATVKAKSEAKSDPKSKTSATGRGQGKVKVTTKAKSKTKKEAAIKAKAKAVKEAIKLAAEEAKIKAEKAAEVRAKAKDPKEGDNVVETTFIESNILISEFFDGIAEGIDLFLAGRRLTKQENETAVQVSNYTYVIDKVPTENATSVGVNLRLPNVEQYWHLKFSNYDESQERGVRRNQLRQTPRSQNVGATVGVFQKLGNVKASFEPRIRLEDPVSISHSLIFESIAEMPKYEINPKLEFFVNPDQGAGIFTALNFHYKLDPIYSVTWVNEGEYEDRPHIFTVTNGISLGHQLSRKSSLSYGFYLVSKNQPHYYLYSYTFAVTYSKLIYKKILDWSVTPQVGFDKDHGFVAVPALTLAINLNF